MLLNILRTVTDFVALVRLLATEELTDEQRRALIDQFIHLQGLDSAVEFDLHDLLMILIAILIIIFWRAWDRADRWQSLVQAVRRLSNAVGLAVRSSL
jgi:hypothetical protein